MTERGRGTRGLPVGFLGCLEDVARVVDRIGRVQAEPHRRATLEAPEVGRADGAKLRARGGAVEPDRSGPVHEEEVVAATEPDHTAELTEGLCAEGRVAEHLQEARVVRRIRSGEMSETR